MKFNKLSWCLGVLLAASTCLAQMYTVTDLGTVHIGGNTWSTVTAINDSGQVIGVSYTTENGFSAHAFRTAPNRPINPATDDFGPGTSAAAINSSGQVVGTYFPGVPYSYTSHAFLTAPNRLLNPATDDLDTLLNTALYAGSLGYGINDSGQAVGILVNIPFNQHSFRTAPNMPIDPEADDLGGPPFNIGFNEPFGINSSGQAVGHFGTAAGLLHAFRTAPNRRINPATDDLGELRAAPYHRSVAFAINDFGQAVGGSIGFYAVTEVGQVYVSYNDGEDVTLPSHAFRTAPNRPIHSATDDLGTFGGNLSAALGIDNFGQVVGFSNLDTAGVIYHAFLYSGHVMHDLNHLIPAGSGWELSSAMGINSKGQIAANGGRNGSGRALLLTPIYRASVQRPIDADGSSVFSAKRGIVPVKFAVTKYDKYSSCTLPATITVTRAAHGTLTPVPESTYSKAEDGSNFRIEGCRYHYNLPARALGVGTYRVDISINGIMVGHAVFALKSGGHEDDKDED
jgi:probable HAF family extracellular repeat protein